MSTTPTDIESRIQKLEAKAKAEEGKIWTFLKTHWAHFVSWAGIAYTILKHL